MKRLLHYLKAHPVITVMAPLFKMLEATFELLVPLVVAQIIDTGIAGNNGPYLWKMGGLLIVLGVVGFAFSLTAQYFAAKSAVSAGMAMRSDLFAHINTFSYQEIDAIGEYRIDKECTLTGLANEALMTALQAKGSMAE